MPKQAGSVSLWKTGVSHCSGFGTSCADQGWLVPAELLLWCRRMCPGWRVLSLVRKCVDVPGCSSSCNQEFFPLLGHWDGATSCFLLLHLLSLLKFSAVICEWVIFAVGFPFSAERGVKLSAGRIHCGTVSTRRCLEMPLTCFFLHFLLSKWKTIFSLPHKLMQNRSLQFGCSWFEQRIMKGKERQSVGAVLTGFQHWHSAQFSRTAWNSRGIWMPWRLGGSNCLELLKGFCIRQEKLCWGAVAWTHLSWVFCSLLVTSHCIGVTNTTGRLLNLLIWI